jgi:excisionase family DNA binding protein
MAEKKKRQVDGAQLLSTQDVATRWGMSMKAVRVIAHSGELPYQQIGYRTWRFRLSDVEIYEGKHRRSS